MMELLEKAEKYAVGKTIDTIDKAIAQAYADGYRDGYKDREEEISIDLDDKKTEFVDLGLPSGTLWAKDYEKESEGFIFLPYEKACKNSIPNLEQMKELLNTCKWNVIRDSNFSIIEVNCIGPNGNFIRFTKTGRIEVDTIVSENFIGYFWIKEDVEDMEKYAGCFSWNKEIHLSKEYSGYKLPIRLVQTKNCRQR